MEPQQITDPAARLIAILQAGLGVAEKSLSVCSEKDDRKVMINLLTPSMDPNTTYFHSTVPSTPTNSAVPDIRFGCEPSYPEGFNPQTTSAFMIAVTGSQ
jgi:hypothetical protein